LEVSLGHLLVAPTSHFTPQKVKGFFVGFTWLRGIRGLKNTLMEISSQGKNWSQFDDSKMIESVPITRILKIRAGLNISSALR